MVVSEALRHKHIKLRDIKRMFFNSVIYKSYDYNNCLKFHQPTVIHTTNRGWRGWRIDSKVPGVSRTPEAASDLRVSRSPGFTQTVNPNLSRPEMACR